MPTRVPTPPARCAVCGAIADINDDDVPGVAYCAGCYLRLLTPAATIATEGCRAT